MFGGGEPLGVDPAAGAIEQPEEGVHLGAELVAAAQADDDPLAAAALLIAVGLDELDVFIDFGRGRRTRVRRGNSALLFSTT